jgi:UDP-N-acetylmuramate--alanine ligase
MRKSLPFDTGPVHFVGIGGIGMSGIAEVMLNLGYEVSGSDIKENANADRGWPSCGAKIMIGHKAENIEGAGALVISTAIKSGNPEVDAARAESHSRRAPGGHAGRADPPEMDGRDCRHARQDDDDLDGGRAARWRGPRPHRHQWRRHQRLCLERQAWQGEWMVVEADESDGTFTKLRPTVAIVTNIDPEHMDHYGSMEALRKGFDTFVENLPFYGFAVLCADHPEVQALASRIPDRRRITYGFNPQSDLWAVNVRSEADRRDVRSRAARARRDGPDALGWPQASDGGAAQRAELAGRDCVARELGGTEEQIRAALSKFGGVKRRFTPVGEWGKVKIIDDYGHHPVEIAAVLRAARDVQGRDKRVIAVVQPHRYTRLRDLFEQFSTCFNDADDVIIAPVYAAGEQPIDGISHETLVKGSSITATARRGDRWAWEPRFGNPECRENRAMKWWFASGAGDITSYANALADDLRALKG